MSPFPRWRWRWAGDALLITGAAVVDLGVWGGDDRLRTGGVLPTSAVLAATAAVYATLLIRRQHPGWAFAVQWTYSLAGLALPGFQPFAGLLVALHAVARHGCDPPARAALAACAVPFSINSYNSAVMAAQGGLPVRTVASTVLWAASALLVWEFARCAHARDRRAEELRPTRTAEAVRAERLRLAHELHDVVSHSVSAMILQVAGARACLAADATDVRTALEMVEVVGVQTMGELRRLHGSLRAVDPAALDDGAWGVTTLRDIDELVEQASASGVDVDTVADGTPAPLDPSVDMTAHRVVQEALANTVKHAGHGASAHIHLLWGSERLTLTVRDRGGLSPCGGDGRPSSGCGLTSLAERITLVGGRLETGAISGGFLVRAELPISAVAPPRGVRALSSGDEQ